MVRELLLLYIKIGMKSLKIALIGYGRMGRMIEQIALGRGHEVVLRQEVGEGDLATNLGASGAEVAIEFTIPSSAYTNCLTCLQLGIPVVSGTTAWGEGVEQLRRMAREQEGKTFLWSSNYSIGVNLFFEINKRVARLMQGAPAYRLALEEVHHVHKLDAPSGTAITLAEEIVSVRSDLDRWVALEEGDEACRERALPITSLREGEVPGIHSVIYRSEVDEIRLTHEAYGREGFALGAVVAAEYASTHSGDLRMADVLSDILRAL